MATATFNELLECSVCLERFIQPKVLPCGHTFCLNCLRGIVGENKELKCPQCRANHVLPKSGVQGFPDNTSIKHFLDMVVPADMSKCYNCSKHTSVSTCEHCKQQICADCRVDHNRLQTEIKRLLRILDGKMTNQCHLKWETALETTSRERTHIETAFNDAVTILNQRKVHLLKEIDVTVSLQKTVMDGKKDVLIGMFEETMKTSDTTESLQEVKQSIDTFDVEKFLSEPGITGVKFTHDVSKIEDYGQLILGNDVASSLSPKRNSVKDTQAGKTVNRTGNLSSTVITSDQNPTVNYAIKRQAFNKSICHHPVKERTFKPVYASSVFNASLIYCISDGDLLIYDMETGKGTCSRSPIKVKDLTVTSTGDLLAITGDEEIIKICPDGQTSVVLTAQNSPLSKPYQICYSEKGVAIIDEKVITLFDEDFKKIREFGSEIILPNSRNRMCVDGDGNFYVSTMSVVRKDSGGWHCSYCWTRKAIIIKQNLSVVVYNEFGERQKQFVIQQHASKEYQYEFLPEEFCGHGKMKRIEDSVPSNQQIKDSLLQTIAGICSDADGYISITLPEENRIEIYNPKGELHCTLGNPKNLAGEFNSPTGLSLTPDGRLIVCDTGNKRLLII